VLIVPEEHTVFMAIALIIIFLLLVGPAALLWGADSCTDDVERRRRGT
jgi:hypothetical protein